MTPPKTNTAPDEQSPIMELVTIFKQELKAAREREDRLIRLLEREQKRNAAWERLFPQALSQRHISKGDWTAQASDQIARMPA